MEFHGRNKSIVVAILFLAITSCTARNSTVTQENGNQGTGGGSTFTSSADLVNSAIDRALALASEQNPSKNIVVQFWNDWARAKGTTVIKSPDRLFPALSSSIIGAGEIPSPGASPSAFNSPALNALKTNKIVRLESGNCLNTPDGRHTDASVSALNTSATLCFSIGNLRKLPPSALLRQVLSLVVHEVAHMGGAQEDEAVFWQTAFSDYFGNRFGDLSVDTVSTPTLKALSECRLFANRALAIAQMNPQDSGVYENVGKIIQDLASLPSVLDPLALNLKIGPTHPELIDNYSNSVVALTQKLTLKFEVRQDKIHFGGITVGLVFMPQDQVVASLEDLVRSIDQITANFLALTGNASDSTCVLPHGKPDLSLFGQFGAMVPSEFVRPQSVCDQDR